MFTFFNSGTLWIGTNMRIFNQIRDELDTRHIPYRYKVKNELGQWAIHGSLRGRTGSIGNPSEQMYQYKILVLKKDLEQANFILSNIQQLDN